MYCSLSHSIQCQRLSPRPYPLLPKSCTPTESPDGLSSFGGRGGGDTWFWEQSVDWVSIPAYCLGQVGPRHPAYVQIPQHSAWDFLSLCSALPFTPSYPTS